jgi:hypothetical protein
MIELTVRTSGGYLMELLPCQQQKQILETYILTQIESQRPAPKISKTRRKHYSLRIRKTQETNHEITQLPGKPGKIGGYEPITPVNTRPRPGKKGYEYIPMTITPKPLKRVYTNQEILFREFFDEVTKLIEAEMPGLSIEEYRVKADYTIQRASGKPYSMQRVIDEVNKLRDYPEFVGFNTLQLLRKLQKFPGKKAKKQTETQRSQEIKRLKTKLGDYLPPQPPQLIPNASMTAIV